MCPGAVSGATKAYVLGDLGVWTFKVIYKKNIYIYIYMVPPPPHGSTVSAFQLRDVLLGMPTFDFQGRGLGFRVWGLRNASSERRAT